MYKSTSLLEHEVNGGEEDDEDSGEAWSLTCVKKDQLAPTTTIIIIMILIHIILAFLYFQIIYFGRPIIL